MDSERLALLHALNYHREHVLGILEDLPDRDLRRLILPSGWTCLGMVQHLAITVERFWFRGIVAGEDITITLTDELSDQAWRVLPEITAESVYSLYGREIELANAVIEQTPLDTPPAFWPEDLWPDWHMTQLRQIMLHVIGETATHAGHLDAARELIDGRQWML